MTDAATFDFWRNRIENAEMDDFALGAKSIAANTTWVFAAQTSPEPDCDHYGTWYPFDTPREAAGYIRHIALPQLLEGYLGLYDGDEGESELLPVDALLAKAKELGRNSDDIAAIEGLISALDKAFSKDEKALQRACSQFADEFNDRFEDTEDWSLTLRVFFSTKAAAEALLARDSEFEECEDCEDCGDDCTCEQEEEESKDAAPAQESQEGDCCCCGHEHAAEGDDDVETELITPEEFLRLAGIVDKDKEAAAKVRQIFADAEEY